MSNKERKKIIEYFSERFGLVKEDFKGFGMFTGNKDRAYLGPTGLLELRPVTVGMIILREGKPTTNFFHLFGDKVTKNIIDIEDASSFAQGLDFETDSKLDGYVLVRSKGFNLGCGFVREGVLRNMVPKSKRLVINLK